MRLSCLEAKLNRKKPSMMLRSMPPMGGTMPLESRRGRGGGRRGGRRRKEGERRDRDGQQQ
jgi:hypothetical protein